LNLDGSLGHSKTPGDFVVDAGDTWRVVVGVLTLSWSNGYATERYSTDSPSCDVLRGQKTSRSWQGSKSTRLTRVAEQGGGLASAPVRSPEGSPGIVRVPAGEFWYGCNRSVEKKCYSADKPGRQITLPAFQIDKTEVTVSAYEACVRAGKCTKPDRGRYCNWEKPGRERHPINCVDWNQAKAYCAWEGKRLPSEQEWEKAARGRDGRKYPWGNRGVSCSRAVIDEDGKVNSNDGCGRKSTWPVGSKPSGASPYGVLDMSGNLWEWTSGWYSATKETRVVRGGSWARRPEEARASARRRGGPASRYHDIGFRCAQ